ncbi:MAG: iron chelate uptake ABC transporter family permease subunit [Acholeplasmataceae bacterium]
MKKNRKIFIIAGILVVIAILLYIFLWMLTTKQPLKLNDPVRNAILQKNITRILVRNSTQVLAMVVSAVLIATTSLVFQTLTNNRILTPSLIGFDAIFVTIQTFIIFIFSSTSILFYNPYVNFITATLLMIIITLFMYRLILRKNRNNIIFLLLVGMVLSTLARSSANFLQTIMDPAEFDSLIIRTQVSITQMNLNVIWIATPLMIFIIFALFREIKNYDVMALGESQAVGLGVNYNQKMNLSLIYIAIAMSISTALIGPISFLGLIAVNAARELLKTYKHLPLFILSSMIAVIFLVIGQVIVAETGYLTSVTVLISLIGGAYMIYLVLKENKI